MTAFRVALNTVVAQQQHLFSAGTSLPRSLKLKALATRIGGRAVVVDELPARLDELKAYFVGAVAAKTLSSIPAGMWDRLPAVFWYGSSPHLGDMPEVLAGVRQHLEGRRGDRCIRALIACYFREFQVRNASFIECATILRTSIHARPKAYARWISCDDQYKLFQPEKAPTTLANYCLTTSTALRDAFKEVARGYDTLAGRFGLAVLHGALDWLSKNMLTVAAKGNVLERLTEWLTQRNAAAPLQIESQVRLANALIEPWDDAQPDDALRKRLVEVLLTFVGDPRLSDAVWQLPQTQGVKPRLLSWLAYGTIEQFFEIIDASAKAHHWNDRRAFWASYAEKGVVTDAWVAYGPKALRLARSASSSTGYGELSGAREQDHSVLLLQIGTLIVADYSHMGSCRFFTADSQYRPNFYASSYSDERLRWDSSEDIAHHTGWQSRFATYIRRQTGIRSHYEGRW